MSDSILGDVITAAATFAGGLIAGGLGLWQFSRQQAQTNIQFLQQQEQKNKAPFLKKQ